MGLSYCNRGGSVGGVSSSLMFVGGSVVVKSVGCSMWVSLISVGGGLVGPLGPLLGDPNPTFWVFPIMVGVD